MDTYDKLTCAIEAAKTRGYSEFAKGIEFATNIYVKDFLDEPEKDMHELGEEIGRMHHPLEIEWIDINKEKPTERASVFLVVNYSGLLMIEIADFNPRYKDEKMQFAIRGNEYRGISDGEIRCWAYVPEYSL